MSVPRFELGDRVRLIVQGSEQGVFGVLGADPHDGRHFYQLDDPSTKTRWPEENLEHENPLLDAALAYGGRGWAVFPCNRHKKPRTAQGFHDATTDQDKIRLWWQTWPDALLAVSCGASELVVIDCDVKHGIDGVANWEALGIDSRFCPTTQTPTGGEHHFYSDPTGEIRNSAGKLAPGVDVRAAGGYVILPPSVTPDSAYTWLANQDATPPPLPDALRVMLRKPTRKPTTNTAPRATATPRDADRDRAYGAAALAGEVDNVLTAPPGKGNRAVYDAALSLGGLVAGGVLPRGEVESALLSAAMQRGRRSESESRATIRSGMEAGMLQPRTRPATDYLSKYAPSTSPMPEALPIRGFNLTDLGNAERLVARHGSDLHYCYLWRYWLCWDGRRWCADAHGEVERRAKEAVRGIYAEAAAITDDAQRKAVANHARRSESKFRLSAMIELAQSEPGMAILPADLDANPWLLNVTNGTLNLRTGELQAHDRDDLITKMAPVVYDPHARLPLWERVVEMATGKNEELAAFLQRAAGYTLTGSTDEEVLLFVHGPTNTGKSTVMEALKAILGDYAQTADFETFLQRRGTGGPRPDIARLAGTRLVLSLEVDEGKRLAEGLIKMLTGGDTVTARELYAKAFEFRPAFKLWLAANHAPKVKAEDDAMWRRIRKIPFDAVIPLEERDPEVKARLRDPSHAGPAILAWALQGCLIWQRDGLGTCPAVEAATATLRAGMDPLHDFLEECVILSPAAWTATAHLRTEYETWCRENGERPVVGREFSASLRAAGCTPVREPHARGWQGIGLLANEEQLIMPGTGDGW